MGTKVRASLRGENVNVGGKHCSLDAATQGYGYTGWHGNYASKRQLLASVLTARMLWRQVEEHAGFMGFL